MNESQVEGSLDADEKKRLVNELQTLEIRKHDAINMNIRRDEILRKEISQIENQNEALRSHTKVLDHQIKKLSLLHSQLTAAPQYTLGKTEVDEILRLLFEM